MSRLPRENLLVRHDSAGAVAPVVTLADWADRRAEIIRGFERVAGEFPAADSPRRCPLDVRLEEETDCGDHLRRRLTFQSEPGSRTPAYLCLPKAALAPANARQFPGVLCLHPTHLRLGVDVVVGLGGTPYPPYASELAARGFVTIAPCYPHLGNYAPDLAALGWASGTLKAVWDNTRALDLLDSLPFVRPSHYATIGHSLGGHNSVFTALFEPRLAAVVSCCGLDSIPDYYYGDPAVWLPGKAWSQPRYLPRMAAYAGRLEEIPFDYAELLAALAPRPLLVIAPLRDANFRAASVDRLALATRQIYRLHGAAAAFRVEHPDAAHDFPPASRASAYALIEQTLR